MLWLRVAYRVGAAFDGLMVIPMLAPGIGGKLFGIAGFNPQADCRYAMMVGASLMLRMGLPAGMGRPAPDRTPGRALSYGMPRPRRIGGCQLLRDRRSSGGACEDGAHAGRPTGLGRIVQSGVHQGRTAYGSKSTCTRLLSCPSAVIYNSAGPALTSVGSCTSIR